MPNTNEKPLDIFQTKTMRAIIGALKSAIHDHGPITKELITSAAKRIYGTLKTVPAEVVAEDCKHDGIPESTGTVSNCPVGTVTSENGGMVE